MNALVENKLVDVADFSDASLRPFLEEVAVEDMISFGWDAPEVRVDAERWAQAMTLRTFAARGLLERGRVFAGVGAGLSTLTFALAARGCVAMPVDTYLELTPYSDLAPAPMMVRPRQFSRLEYARGGVLPLHGDARALDLPDDFFDGVYAPGLLSRLDGWEAVEEAAAEIARILKPGGAACLSADLRLEGPNDGESPHDRLLMTPERIRRHVVEASGLRFTDEPRYEVSAASYSGEPVLRDLLERRLKRQTLDDKADLQPNLVRFQDGFLVSTVHLSLLKPQDAPAAGRRKPSPRLQAVVDRGSLLTSGALTQQITDWRRAFEGDRAGAEQPQASPARLTADLLEAHACLARVVSENHRAERRLFRIEDASGGAETFSFYDLLQSWTAAELPRQIGSDLPTGRRSERRDGVISFGPYTTLDTGHYRVGVSVRALGRGAGEVGVDVVAANGVEVVARRTLAVTDLPGSIDLDLDVEGRLEAVEFRVTCGGGAEIEFRGVRLFRRRLYENG